MAEKHTIVAGDTVGYGGLIQMNDLFTLINSYLRQVGYDKRVTHNEQQVIGNKKHIFVQLKPWKKISDYIKFEIKIGIDATIEDVEIRIDDVPTMVQKGNIKIKFFGAVITDYEKSWEQKPEYFFLRTLFNKFVYKVKMTEWDGMLKNQVAHLKAEIASFLNMKRFDDGEHHTTRDMIK